MGILDNVIGSLLGGNDQNQGAQGQGGIGGVLSSILGGGQTGHGAQGGGLGGMLGGAGIGGLVSQFEQAGLGHIAQSWIGDGANQSVTPDQLQNVFGDKVPGMAQQAGMSQGDFLSQLSQHLPGAVDNATSNGQAGDNGSVNV